MGGDSLLCPDILLVICNFAASIKRDHAGAQLFGMAHRGLENPVSRMPFDVAAVSAAISSLPGLGERHPLSAGCQEEVTTRPCRHREARPI
jgi:hypothetical protein